MTSGNTMAHADGHHHEEHHVDQQELKYVGFWFYLMSDLLIFGSLFATFAVLLQGTFGNLTHKELATMAMSNAVWETALLLTSSFTSGLAVLYMKTGKAKVVIFWLVATLLLGLGFMYLEITEFLHLIHEGHSFTASAFLTAFFGLVGTHGLHVSIGILWLVAVIIQVWIKPLDEVLQRKVKVFSLFWHFLDIVWIFVFTYVYLMGVI